MPCLALTYLALPCPALPSAPSNTIRRCLPPYPSTCNPPYSSLCRTSRFALVPPSIISSAPPFLYLAVIFATPIVLCCLSVCSLLGQFWPTFFVSFSKIIRNLTKTKNASLNRKFNYNSYNSSQFLHPTFQTWHLLQCIVEELPKISPLPTGDSGTMLLYLLI